ncbi:hypothetical protein B0H34DRAFT_673512 [Crassisporium funariophilum]|nr:hypothetical protein B0H34DRAFT_673512 [Crassisporium funariophilum]
MGKNIPIEDSLSLTRLLFGIIRCHLMSKIKKKPSTFTALSTRYCEACKVNVKISFGGETNWTAVQALASASDPSDNTSKSQSGSTTSNLMPALVTTSTPITELKNLAVAFPNSVPNGTADKPLAQFSRMPQSKLLNGGDPWECLDPILNGAIGYGITAKDLAKIIWRGPLGLDGMCRWIRGRSYGYEVNWCKDTNTVIVSHYNFLATTEEANAIDDRLVLQSNNCSGEARTLAKGKEVMVQPCTYCANIKNHAIVMGTHHCNLDRPHKSTRWHYLSGRQMYLLLKKKNHLVNALKLKSHNADQAVYWAFAIAFNSEDLEGAGCWSHAQTPLTTDGHDLVKLDWPDFGMTFLAKTSMGMAFSGSREL